MKGQFLNHKDRYRAVKSILNSHLLEHRKNLKKLSYSDLQIRTTLRNKIGVLLYRCIIEVLLKSLPKSNILQLKVENDNLQRLISQKPFKRNDYNILVVNVSSEELDVEKLRYGLHLAIQIRVSMLNVI